MASTRFRRRRGPARAPVALTLLLLALALFAAAWLGLVRGGDGAGPGGGGGVAPATVPATSGGADVPATVPMTSGGADAVGTGAAATSDERLDVEPGTLGEFVPEALGRISDEVAQAPASRETEVVDAPVADAAQRLVEDRRTRADAVLVQAGYLDLKGDSWGCVISGAGWVEVVVVSATEDGKSQVTTLRMEAEEWERAYGTEGS